MLIKERKIFTDSSLALNIVSDLLLLLCFIVPFGIVSTRQKARQRRKTRNYLLDQYKIIRSSNREWLFAEYERTWTSSMARRRRRTIACMTSTAAVGISPRDPPALQVPRGHRGGSWTHSYSGITPSFGGARSPEGLRRGPSPPPWSGNSPTVRR